VLEVENVAFVTDPTQSSGVRADMGVAVDGRIWKQVPTLRTSSPTEAHYTVRMTEDGFPAIGFGNGRAGRRLPGGSNNVRVSFRVGTGLAGNLAAGKLVKPVRPHRLLKGVRQPLPATGGNDMESVESMRENAPASVLTLDRAVSLRDFAHLATRQSSVWQAAAFLLPETVGRHATVEVVVVPAGGGELGGVGTALRSFLETHALPGVRVVVSPFTPGSFDLEVTLRVDSAAFDPAQVESDVRESLLATFSLERRGLGQDLFLSEVFQVVESVKGVENSTCVIDGDPETRRRRAAQREVIHLAPGTSNLEIRSQEFEL
jgi:predicted phage baseplate assembly protein